MGQEKCNPSATKKCTPPTPCWGAEANGGTVTAQHFGKYKDMKGPGGIPWIDQAGGPHQPKVEWCPGQTVPFKYFIYADHNGVYRFESQHAAPGMEKENAFESWG